MLNSISYDIANNIEKMQINLDLVSQTIKKTFQNISTTTVKYTKRVLNVTNNGLKTVWKGFTKVAKNASSALQSLVQKKPDEDNETGIVHTPNEDVLPIEKKPEVIEAPNKDGVA